VTVYKILHVHTKSMLTSSKLQHVVQARSSLTENSLFQ